MQPETVAPYCGPAVTPASIWQGWNGEPLLLAALGFLMLLALWVPAGPPIPVSAARRPLGMALAGTLALAVAFVSPLCALTVTLFTARAAHHVLIAGIAAPLLALGFPLLGRLALRIGSGPLWVALAAVIWLWHLPSLYALTWTSTLVYWAMQAALLGSAVLFWSAVIHDAGRDPVRAAALLAGMAGQMGLLGAILTFSPYALYPEHLPFTSAFGLSLIEDQQLGGLVMWVPGFVPFAAAAALLVRRGWLRGHAA